MYFPFCIFHCSNTMYGKSIMVQQLQVAVGLFSQKIIF